MNIFKVVASTTDKGETKLKTPPPVEEDQKNFLNDFDLSVKLMTQSFITWHRLETQHIVKEITLRDIKHRDKWQQKYPSRFIPLHTGSRCTDSIIIGKGKYSRVYKRGNYAYKFIKVPKHREDLSVLKCNLKELLFFHSMNHPNVMRPIRSQLVMEHGRFRRIIHEMPLAKHTLQSMILSNEITSFDDIVSIMVNVAKGLAYMHRHQVVHGDIKPSNILIMPDYTPIISDFTLTTFQHKGNEIAFGTLFWRAPECLTQVDCTVKSDVWSFGVMLLDCFYGCIYFRDILGCDSNKDMLHKLLHVLGQPSFEWVSRYMKDNTGVLFSKSDQIYYTMNSSPIKILGHEEDKRQFSDLLSHILVWEPDGRYTMEEVLAHPFFNKSGVNTSVWTESRDDSAKMQESLLSHMIAQTLSQERSKRTCVIRWRNDFEKQHIRSRILTFHRRRYGGGGGHGMGDWLLQDIIVASKRLIETLRRMGVTFHTNHIIQWCTAFYCFIWEDRWIDDEEFESAIYHMLQLIDFIGFPFTVTEQQLSEVVPVTNN